MKPKRFETAFVAACLLLSSGISPLAAGAQSKIEVSTRLEISPQHVIMESRPSYSGAESTPPFKLLKEPEYRSKKPRYGKLAIGNAKDKNEIVVVMDEAEGEEPRIYIDANNNRDLTDDGSPEWDRSGQGIYQKTVAIRAAFDVGGRTEVVELPYGVYLFADKERKKRGVLYHRKYGRIGTLELAGRQYKIAVTTFDNRGIYSDREQLAVAIDLNGDGKLDLSRDSAELYKGAEPFNIAGESYRIARASELGDRILIEVSPEKVEPRRRIAEGEPAQDFDFETLDGRQMKLSDFRGKVVMLDFWATWCGPCIKDLPDMKRIYASFDRSKFEIIGISLDGKPTRTPRDRVVKFIKQHDIAWPNTFDDGGWGNAIARMYRVRGIPRQLIIDQSGIIRMVTGGADASGSKLEHIQKTIEELLKK